MRANVSPINVSVLKSPGTTPCGSPFWRVKSLKGASALRLESQLRLISYVVFVMGARISNRFAIAARIGKIFLAPVWCRLGARFAPKL